MSEKDEAENSGVSIGKYAEQELRDRGVGKFIGTQ